MNGVLQKNQIPPPVAHTETSACNRRRFLYNLSLALLTPFWAVACERAETQNRQGADNMYPNQQNVANDAATTQRIIPELDTRIPAVIQTATFAMG